jgi:hypothetical protein
MSAAGCGRPRDMSNTQPNANGPRVPEKPRIQIGSRVRCNRNFAAAYVGKTGTIISVRHSAVDGQLYVIRLDEPTAAADSWPKLETLGATADSYELLPEQPYQVKIAIDADAHTMPQCNETDLSLSVARTDSAAYKVLKLAVFGPSKMAYDTVRKNLISKYGYFAFRTLQNKIFADVLSGRVDI